MLADLIFRVKALFGRKRMEADLDDEVRFHFEQQVEKNLREGMGEEEARRQARLLFGGIDEVKEECRDARGVSFVETTWQDLRYAARRLRKSPGFTTIAVLSLALGIGANTAIFSLVDAVLLRSLPVEKPEELELVRRVGADSARTLFAYPMYRRIRSQSEIFAGVVGRVTQVVQVTVDGEASRKTLELATGNYFSVLGVRPTIGRFFDEDDDRLPGQHPVAVLSFRFWRESFSEDATVAGKTIRINDSIYTVVGVAPPGFFGVEVGTTPDVWAPAMQTEEFLAANEPGKSLFDSDRVSWMTIVARRRPGVDQEQAEAALNVLYQRLHEANSPEPEKPSQFAMDLMPGGRGFSRLRGAFDNPLFVLMTLVTLILALACLNVANLLLGRYAARRSEIGVRLALGAGRFRLGRQLIAESVLLGGLGAAGGVVASIWAIGLLTRYIPADRIPLPLQSAADARTLVFAAAVSCLSVMAFGLLPAWNSTRSSVVASLRDKTPTYSLSGWDLRRLLVIAQVTLALLLVVGGGLFAQSLKNMASLDLGVDTNNVLMAGINPKQNGYTPERTDAFFRELRVRLGETLGVQSVGYTYLPLLAVDFLRDGDESAAPDEPGERATTLEVSNEFFSAIGITLLRGRTFGPRDTADSARVAVISETAARYYFPGEDPIGKPAPILRTAGEVIGVVRDARLRDVHQPPGSAVYMSSEQRGGYGFQQTLYIRTEGDAASYAPVLRRIVYDLDSTLPVFEVKTFAAQKDESLARERLVAAMSGAFGLLSLLLAAIGVYGVVAYGVVARTREMGVRMSLGAKRGDVLWMIQRDALRLTALGIAIGIPLSLALYRLLKSQLFGVEPNDALTLAATTAILGAVAFAAAWIPARRAASIAPATVLRCDQ